MFKICLICALFSTSITSLYSQGTLRLKKGVVVDSLTTPSTKGVFSLYLPKAFDLEKAWPILFGFDSKSNMSSLTHLFKQSAEEEGYIVAVSNYGEKLSVKDKSTYIRKFLTHMISLFPIQEKRMYVLGMQEDAPLNTSLPLVFQQLNGVVAIGNSYDFYGKIFKQKNFSFIGIIDDTNFRYADFINTNKYLKQKGISATLYTYEDRSGMVPEDIVSNILPDFTLDAIRRGSIPKDSSWISKRYEKDLRKIQLLEQQEEYLQVYDALERIENRYHLFFDLTTIKEEQKRIRKIKTYKQQKRLQNKYLSQEKYLKQTFLLSLGEDINGKKYDNLGWWQYEMAELDKLTKTKERYAKGMVWRIKGYLKNTLLEYKQLLSDKENELLDKKIFLNIMSTIIDEKDYDSYKNIISLSTQDGDIETALFYLEKMLKNGYKNIERLYDIDGTLFLRISKEYNVIIKKYLGTSKYFSFN